MREKRVLSTALSLALAAGMLSVPASAARFTDMQNHWAQADVEYLSTQGLVSGYNDGTFKPDAAMSTIEALLFCARIPVLDSNTKRLIVTDWTDELRMVLPASMMSWAASDLSVCLATGIISMDELSSLTNRDGLMSAIPREDVAKYLARAMQLAPMAEHLTTYTLDFADTSAISQEIQPYVYVLSNYGIVKGDEFNNFQPKSSLNRASMTSLLRRGLEFMTARGISVELPQYTTNKWVGGVIRTVQSNSKGNTVLSLASPLGTIRTVTLPSNVKIYQDNMLTTDSALKNGIYVRVNQNNNGTASSVRIGGALTTVSGPVVSIQKDSLTIREDGVARTLPADRFIEIQNGSQVGGLELLDASAGYTSAECFVDAMGHLAAIRFSGGTQAEEGILSDVKFNAGGGAQIQLTGENGTRTQYAIPAGAVVLVNGSSGALSSSQIGDFVTLRVSTEDRTQVSEVQIDTLTEYIQGSIRTISTKNYGKLTVEQALKGKTTSHSLLSGTEVTYEGNLVDVSDLHKGDFVTIRLDDDGNALYVAASPGSVTVEGTIQAILYGSPTTIQLAQRDGTVVNYDVDLNAPPLVYRNKVRTTVDKLRSGDEAVFTIRYNAVTRIDATPKSANASGTIQKVSLDNSGTTIEVLLDDNTAAAYLVDETVSVTQNGKAVSIDSLKPGFKIDMVLEGSQILSIEVSRGTAQANQLTGTILYVNRSEWELLVQRDDNTSTALTVYVGDAVIRSTASTNTTLSLSDLETGDGVMCFGAYDGLVFRATLVLLL